VVAATRSTPAIPALSRPSSWPATQPAPGERRRVHRAGARRWPGSRACASALPCCFAASARRSDRLP